MERVTSSKEKEVGKGKEDPTEPAGKFKKGWEP